MSSIYHLPFSIIHYTIRNVYIDAWRASLSGRKTKQKKANCAPDTC